MQRRNKMQGYIVVFCFVIIPVLFLYLFFQKLEQGREINSQYYAKKLRFVIENSKGEVSVHAWKSEEDNQYSLFLPAFATETNTHMVSLETDGIFVYLDEKPLTQEEGIYDFDKEVSYSIEFRDASDKILEKSNCVIYQSKYLPAVYVDTRTGDSNYVKESKDAKEEGNITIVTSEGTVDYEGPLTYLKGRGNATWEYPKKPYNIKLKQKGNLLNLGEGETFSLLANWADNSFIRNKIAYDIGKGVGLENTTNAEFVDLFLNGEYNGTYQLTQKVNAPAYFLEMEILERWKNEPKGFLTTVGQAVTVKAPENISYDEVEKLGLKFQELEDAIFAKDGVNPKTGKSYTQMIDMSSWAKVYLVQEVMQNYDAYVSSLFMYTKDLEESPIYCGPIWDFDWSLIKRDGTEANVLTANQSRHPYTNYWMPSLYAKEEFQKVFKEEYRTIFLPVIKEVLEQKIPKYEEQLNDSMQMNTVRWKKQNLDQWKESVTAVSEYLAQRSESLLDIWENPEEFYQIHMECNSDSFGSMDYYVKPGETCENFPEGLQKMGYEFTGWYLVGTEELLDVEAPVQSNLSVEARWQATGEESQLISWISTEVLQIRYILSAILIIGLIGLIACDVRSRKRRDRQNHE